MPAVSLPARHLLKSLEYLYSQFLVRRTDSKSRNQRFRVSPATVSFSQQVDRFVFECECPEANLSQRPT